MHDVRQEAFCFRDAFKAPKKDDPGMRLTVQYNPHLGLEVLIGELPQGKGLPGRVLQQAEGDADGVFWRDASRVDEPAGGGREGQAQVLLLLLLQSRVSTKGR